MLGFVLSPWRSVLGDCSESLQDGTPRPNALASLGGWATGHCKNGLTIGVDPFCAQLTSVFGQFCLGPGLELFKGSHRPSLGSFLVTKGLQVFTWRLGWHWTMVITLAETSCLVRVHFTSGLSRRVMHLEDDCTRS